MAHTYPIYEELFWTSSNLQWGRTCSRDRTNSCGVAQSDQGKEKSDTASCCDLQRYGNYFDKPYGTTDLWSAHVSQIESLSHLHLHCRIPISERNMNTKPSMKTAVSARLYDMIPSPWYPTT
jgi:hypothetical protein